MSQPMRKLLLFALLFALPLAGTNSNAQEKASNDPASAQREPMLVTVDWLDGHLSDPSLVLLQIVQQSKRVNTPDGDHRFAGGKHRESRDEHRALTHVAGRNRAVRALDSVEVAIERAAPATLVFRAAGLLLSRNTRRISVEAAK